MKLLKKKDLDDYGHDVYEICSAKDYPNHWNEKSIYFTMEDCLIIEPYLGEVFLQYHYYGPQKVTLLEWETLKNIALTKEKQEESIGDFFDEIDNWIRENNRNHDHFWIHGV